MEPPFMDRQLLIANRMHYTGWTSQQRIPRDEDAAVSQGCREDLSEIIVGLWEIAPI
jgi:hypothetical protein